MKFRNRAISSSVAGVFCVTAGSALAQVGETPDRYGPYNHGHDMVWGSSQWGGFGMVLGPIVMILIVVGIVAGAIYLMRLSDVAGSSGGQLAQDRALVLLKERYAKGEIDSDEFAERKKLLAD